MQDYAYKIGDRVKLKNILYPSKRYYMTSGPGCNTYSMSPTIRAMENCGKELVICEHTNVRYVGENKYGHRVLFVDEMVDGANDKKCCYCDSLI